MTNKPKNKTGCTTAFCKNRPLFGILNQYFKKFCANIQKGKSGAISVEAGEKMCYSVTDIRACARTHNTSGRSHFAQPGDAMRCHFNQSASGFQSKE